LNRKVLRNLILLFALIVLFLVIYWIKNQAGINLSDSFSLSDYGPFKYLRKNQIISMQNPGVIFDDSFDSLRLFDNWFISWMQEEGRVTKGYDSNGGNNSRCLLIRSSSEKSWVCAYYWFVEVHKGDRFNFKGVAKLKGEKVSAYVSMAAYDKDKKAINWNYIQEKVGKKDLWANFDRSFIISDDGINYIRFRLSGSGVGEFRFDGICFRKTHETLNSGESIK